jgi:hypothetical protein
MGTRTARDACLGLRRIKVVRVSASEILGEATATAQSIVDMIAGMAKTMA